MAKSISKLQDFDSKNTNTEKPEPNVNFTQSVPKSLYARMVKCRKAIGCSSEQELVRMGMTMFLERNGF